MSLRLIQGGLFLVLAACSGGPSQSAQVQQDRPFTVSEVATFEAPWAMSFLPGSGVPLTNLALVTEKAGRLWLVDARSGKKQEVSGVPQVVAEGQGGLLDVVASPAFAGDQLVYFTFAERSRNGGSQLALARAKLNLAGRPALTDVQIIWRNPEGGKGGHFGARIAFAPDGQSLFLSAGDRQRFTPAQDSSQPMGKILHLTLDGKPAPGNPWAGNTGAPTVSVTDPPEDSEKAKTAPARRVTWPGTNLTPSETWTVGHRNPLGLAFAPDGRLWEMEMGPKGGDELNLIEKGKNYGWPLVSFGVNYNDVPIPSHDSKPEFAKPVLYWTPVIAPGNLMFYRGKKTFPQWDGSGFVSGLGSKTLTRIIFDGKGGAKPAERWDLGKRIRDVAQAPDGTLWLLEDDNPGALIHVTPK